MHVVSVTYTHSHLFLTLPGFTSMALCKTAVTPMLMHWSYCSLALSHFQNRVLEPCGTQCKHDDSRCHKAKVRPIPKQCVFWWWARCWFEPWLQPGFTSFIPHIYCSYIGVHTLTLKHRETHGCVVSTVATDALVLKHQAISILSTD